MQWNVYCWTMLRKQLLITWMNTTHNAHNRMNEMKEEEKSPSSLEPILVWGLLFFNFFFSLINSFSLHPVPLSLYSYSLRIVCVHLLILFWISITMCNARMCLCRWFNVFSMHKLGVISTISLMTILIPPSLNWKTCHQLSFFGIFFFNLCSMLKYSRQNRETERNNVFNPEKKACSLLHISISISMQHILTPKFISFMKKWTIEWKCFFSVCFFVLLYYYAGM